MEPVTHFLTGACLGRAGFNRKTAYATLAMTLAAETPDLDILWRLRGPVAGLEHHRGITHTLIAAPIVALFVTGAVWLFDRLVSSKAWTGMAWTRIPGRKSDQPVRWPLVWLFSLIAVLSHLLLDYTNNYGIRPFFPFNPRWYSWDIVFVIEPLMLAALLLALVMPALFGLADREMGVRRTRFRGRGWAISAFCFIALLYVVRNAERAHAVGLLRNGNVTREPVARIGVEPYPINPFKWFGVMQTADYYQTAIVHTLSDEVDTDPGELIYKPAETPATAAAKVSWLGRTYIDWAGFPVVTDRGAASNLPPAAPGLQIPTSQQWTAVQFEDLRYAYPPVAFGGFNRNGPPLSGWVYVGPGHEIEATVMDGREQK